MNLYSDFISIVSNNIVRIQHIFGLHLNWFLHLCPNPTPIRTAPQLFPTHLSESYTYSDNNSFGSSISVRILHLFGQQLIWFLHLCPNPTPIRTAPQLFPTHSVRILHLFGQQLIWFLHLCPNPTPIRTTPPLVPPSLSESNTYSDNNSFGSSLSVRIQHLFGQHLVCFHPLCPNSTLIPR